MKFEYEIKGMTLDVYDLMDIHHYYEASCTGEYLMDNYDIEDESEALHLGYRIREIMDKYDLDEETAIDRVMNER